MIGLIPVTAARTRDEQHGGKTGPFERGNVSVPASLSAALSVFVGDLDRRHTGTVSAAAAGGVTRSLRDLLERHADGQAPLLEIGRAISWPSLLRFPS